MALSKLPFHKQDLRLLFLLAGTGALAALALAFSGTPSLSSRTGSLQAGTPPEMLAASTWLAQQQNVGRSSGNYPDWTNCYYFNLPPGYGADPNVAPTCQQDNNGSKEWIKLWPAMFSAHKANTADGGKTVGRQIRWLNERYVPKSGVYVPPVCVTDPARGSTESASRVPGGRDAGAWRCNSYPNPNYTNEVAYCDDWGNCYNGQGTRIEPTITPDPVCRVPEALLYSLEGPRGTIQPDSNGCPEWESLPPSFSTVEQTVNTGPAAVQLAEGEQLTLEWSCLPSKKITNLLRIPSGNDTCFIPGVGCSGDWQPVNSTKINTVSTGFTGTGPGFDFSSSGMYGSRTVTPPAGNHAYTFTCNGPAAAAMSIPVVVGANQPDDIRTVTVTAPLANAAEPSTNGQFQIRRTDPDNVALTVHFMLGGTANRPHETPADYSLSGTGVLRVSGNTYQATIPALATHVNVNVMVTDDMLVEENETVVPSLVARSGYYTVGAASSTLVTIADNDTGESVCPNGANNPPQCTTCPAGSQMQDGACVSGGCPNGALNPPSCALCPPGFQMQGGLCVLQGCQGPNRIPPSCNCAPGYVLSGTACILPAVVDLKANGSDGPVQVRTGETVLLTWMTENATSCTLKNAAGTTLSTEPNRGAPGLGALITGGQQTFTLSCLDQGGTPKTDTVQVGVLASWMEE